jgi:hypothetical protein
VVQDGGTVAIGEDVLGGSGCGLYGFRFGCSVWVSRLLAVVVRGVASGVLKVIS